MPRNSSNKDNTVHSQQQFRSHHLTGNGQYSTRPIHTGLRAIKAFEYQPLIYMEEGNYSEKLVIYCEHGDTHKEYWG